jgi:hypothetical protein
MDVWCGKIATIAYIDSSNDCINIWEDKGRWIWSSSDFEEIDTNEPNLAFVNKKRRTKL